MMASWLIPDANVQPTEAYYSFVEPLLPKNEAKQLDKEKSSRQDHQKRPESRSQQPYPGQNRYHLGEESKLVDHGQTM